jgi:hypothetical protein
VKRDRRSATGQQPDQNDVVHHVRGLVARVPEDQRRLLLSTVRAMTGDAAALP